MIVRISKGRGGRADTLTVVRDDGSSTWGRLHDGIALHDLTHLSLEGALGIERGFLGLVGEGWEMSDFGTPWPRGRVPAEAFWVEATVGAIWQRWIGGDRYLADELNREMAAFCEREGVELHRTLSDAELDRVYTRLEELTARWQTVQPGEALEVVFQPSAV